MHLIQRKKMQVSRYEVILNVKKGVSEIIRLLMMLLGDGI